MEKVTETLDRLIRERGDEYLAISRMLGRNAAYIQQFIKRGVPKKLDEDDRRVLATYFGVSESILGAPEREGALSFVPQLAIGASLGRERWLMMKPPSAEWGLIRVGSASFPAIRRA